MVFQIVQARPRIFTLLEGASKVLVLVDGFDVSLQTAVFGEGGGTSNHRADFLAHVRASFQLKL